MAELVGRHHELAEIEQLLERAGEGRGGLLTLVGPAGSGKTALADAAADRAERGRLQVVRATPIPGHPVGELWARVLADAGAPPSLVDAGARDRRDGSDRDDGGPEDAARWLAAGVGRLIIVDDLDVASGDGSAFLGLVSARLAVGGSAIVVTSSTPFGLGREIALAPLERGRLAQLCPHADPPSLEAIWLASLGRPGSARRYAVELAAAAPPDPIVHLALTVPSTAAFLDVDVALVGLLEAALARPLDDATRARLLARLARELLGDPTAGGRRARLVGEALDAARRSGDAVTLAEVLDARLHALWDPTAAEDRLRTADEIVALATASGGGELERRGHFWAFTALMELGHVGEAEAALARYARACRTAGDAAGEAIVVSRHAMLAALRGRFDEATELTEQFATRARLAGLADTDALTASLLASIAVQQGLVDALDDGIDALNALVRLHPGQLYEATAACALALVGRATEAGAELRRCLPGALRGSGPRWLRSMAELAIAAVAAGDRDAATKIETRLLPYRGRLILGGGAAAVLGPASFFIGLLALALDDLDDAVTAFDEAAALEEQIGALPGLANALAGLAAATQRVGDTASVARSRVERARADALAATVGMRSLLVDRLLTVEDEWKLRRDGDDWLLDGAGEHVRLRDARGVHYLRTLLANPRRDLLALDLAADGNGLVAPSPEPVIDGAARADYRARLEQLDDELDAADRAGDQARADRISRERDAIVAELGRAIGIAGRRRVISAEAERARVHVTRAVRATIDRIRADAPRVAAHLDASIRTGQSCRYEPNERGPARWRL